MRKINLFIKRAADFLCSGLGIILLSPFLLVIALWIKLSSKGPVFFLQERLGYKGKPASPRLADFCAPPVWMSCLSCSTCSWGICLWWGPDPL